MALRSHATYVPRSRQHRWLERWTRAGTASGPRDKSPTTRLAFHEAADVRVGQRHKATLAFVANCSGGVILVVDGTVAGCTLDDDDDVNSHTGAPNGDEDEPGSLRAMLGAMRPLRHRRRAVRFTALQNGNGLKDQSIAE